MIMMKDSVKKENTAEKPEEDSGRPGLKVAFYMCAESCNF